MRTKVALWRATLLLPLAALLAFLASGSSLARLLPWPLAGIWGLAVAGAFALALAPAAFARGSPLPATLLVVVPTLAAASYGASRLDWLQLLKDFGVKEETGLRLGRVALAAVALLLTWLVHVVDLTVRVRLRAQARGIPPEEGRAASIAALRAAAPATALAAAGTAALALVGIVAGLADAEVLLAGRAALVAPLAAVALLAVGAWLALGRSTAP